MTASPQIKDLRTRGGWDPMTSVKSIDVQRLTNIEKVHDIEFVEDAALVEVPIDLIFQLPLKNDHRSNSRRLRRVKRAIRAYGYNNHDPVIVRIGRRGRWVVHDGGHRLTAAKLVSREFLTNLYRPKVRRITFLVFKTDLSYSAFKMNPANVADNETHF